MTKKEKFMQDIQYAIDYKVPRFYVKVATRGSKGLELIVNPFCNFEQKKEYYDKAYDDNLVLKSYDGIRIVSWDCFYPNDKAKHIRDIVFGDNKGEDIYHV